MCAVSLAACSDSDEMPQDNSAVNGIKQVGENEYVVTVGTEASGSADSRGINPTNNTFDNNYDPNVLYVHSTKSDNNRKVLTFSLGENKSFSFRIRKNDDGSFALSSDVVNLIDTSNDNAEEYASDETVYFSSWLTDEWSNTVESDPVQVGENNYISVMFLQERTSNPINNWREIYRSAGIVGGTDLNYDADELLGLGGSANDIVVMRRVVSGYMNGVIFTDLANEQHVSDATVWNSIITDEKGQLDDWTIRLYLGEFPTSYNLCTSTNGTGKAYYAANKGEKRDFEYATYTTGGLGGTEGGYSGYGLLTDKDYLLTPVAEDRTNPLKAYILVNNDNFNKTLVAEIEEFGEETLGGASVATPCYAIPGQIEQLVVIYDLRDLAQQFGLKYKNAAGQEVVWQDGKEVDASTVSVQSLKSRASGGETEFVELQPRKVIRKTIY